MGKSNTTISLGIFILRFGLGIFLALWGINKIISPESAALLFATNFSINIYPSLVMIIGALELVLSLLMLFGIYKSLTYGLALIIQTVSSLAVYHEILTPFGPHINYVSNIPILCAFITLFLLRNHDNRWTLSKKPKMFSS